MSKITKTKDGYKVVSQGAGVLGSRFPTMEQAIKRLRQVEQYHGRPNNSKNN